MFHQFNCLRYLRVVFAVGCSALITLNVAASEPTGADFEALEERIANSPELSELQASYEAQERAWYEGLWCQLMQSDEPEVRVLAAEAAIGANDADCRVNGEWLSPALVWEQAIWEATDNPALLLKRYRKERHADDEAFVCEKDELSQSLLALEPDNAFYYLLAMPEFYSVEYEMPCDGREWILAAAGAEDFNAHYSDGQYAAYLEISAYALNHPPPLPGEPLREAWDEFDMSPYMKDPAGEPSLTLIGIQQPTMGSSIVPVIGRCRQALEDSDDQLMAACLTLADLMIENGRTVMTYMLGNSLRDAAFYPAGKASGQATDPNRWRGWRNAMVLECQTWNSVTNWNALAAMPPDYYRTHIQDYSSLGELAAYRNFAARAYAVDPSLFALDPSRCEDIRQLDEAVQQELVSLWRQTPEDGQPRGWNALLAAAEALDAQATQGSE